jgi:hypothetical protein
MVTHTYNLSYVGGIIKRIMGWDQLGKKEWDQIWEAKQAEGVTQVI